jgi:hypothetical protein
MHLPVLDIPTLNLTQRPKPVLRPRKLGRWVAQLPIANPPDAARALLRQVHVINHSCYDAKDRMKLMTSLLPISHRLLQALVEDLKSEPVPLNDHAMAQVSLIESLLEELATGYKLIVSDLSLWEQEKARHSVTLQEALYFSVKWLAMRLLVTYAAYQPEPDGVWRELNQLYRFAEDCDITGATVDDTYDVESAAVTTSVDRLYKQVILLALAEPYNLMHNEVWKLNNLAANWAETVQFLTTDLLPLDNEYVVDLAGGDAPRLYPPNVGYVPQDGRVIDLSEARTLLNRMLENVLRSSQSDQHLDAPPLHLRQRRDMLLRLAKVWSNSSVRRSQRRRGGAAVQIVFGLNGCHYFASRRATFTPEMDELRMKTLEHAGSAQVSSASVFAGAFREALQKDRRHSHNGYAVSPLTQRNISRDGMALSCPADAASTVPAHVGELVAYRQDAESDDRWRIGVIRWLKAAPEAGTDLGVMHLATTGVPIGVRALHGTGEGTDYFRGLLIPKQVSLQQVRSLIVPGSVYDVGTVVAVNMGNKLFHVRLARLLQSTPEFAQYEFKTIPSPPVRM